ncbi:MAG TPA: LLM class F420-dependent oxidoreductase [Acidimicrobiia bacterium]|jgi:F420-dependent oxidoreductase-like protein
MKLGTTIGLGSGGGGLAERARRLEGAGIEYFWSGEAYSADCVSALGYLAAVTERAQLGTSILPIYSRTPTLLAMTAVGMDQVSNGRFILGIGASGPQVVEGFHGVPYDRPLGRTREIVDVCRKVWRRERLEHSGPSYTVPLPEDQGTGLGKALKLIDHPVRDRIPIYIASLGPKNVALTAELAEGWLPLHYWPDKARDVWQGAIDAGAAKRSPDLPPLEIVAGGPLAIGDDVDHLREHARPHLALYFGGMGAKGQNFYNDVLRAYGFEQEADEIQDLYLEGKKDEAAALVPQELVDGIPLVGDAGYVKDRITAYAESGVTVLNVDPIGPNGVDDIATVASWLA